MDAMGSIYKSVNLAIESLEGIVPDGWLVVSWLLQFLISLPIQKEKPDVKRNDCRDDMSKEEETNQH